jgi:hypothetical protein
LGKVPCADAIASKGPF